MRHIVHSEAPPASIVAAHRAEPHPVNPRQAWKAFDSGELREHLWELQSGLCAYCERTLGVGPHTSSVEHIIPKSGDGKVTFQYTNLVLCCLDPATCNLHKKGQHFGGFDATGRSTQGFIDPTQSRCDASFRYERDGSVHPSDQARYSDATETIRILNLNHEPLKTERRQYLGALDKTISDMGDQLDAILHFLAAELQPGAFKPFYSAKRQHFSMPT